MSSTEYLEGVLRERLMVLMTQAAKYRSAIEGAKTNTKRVYFENKLKKIQPDVIRLVNALSVIPKDTSARESNKDATTSLAD